MYIDIGNQAADMATLAFTLDTSTVAPTNRMWEIKVTQLPCTKDTPNGCLQYHTGLTGRFTTFNFIPSDDNHLSNQE